jgi:amino acid adenylation domain-containing protein
MSTFFRNSTKLPLEQETIRAKCFHPTGKFCEFSKDEIDQSIADRFEQQVAKYPNRFAIKSRNFTLTYDELNRMANRVARAILARRGEGEEPIALLLEHGALLVASMLGVLKAGKIYVPLDPAYPRTRTVSMAEDCEPGLVVTNSKNLPSVRELVNNEQRLINIDELDPSLPGENPGLSLSPDTLAWILYTSGSTGRPKGVVQNHRSTLNEIRRHTNSFQICLHDRLSFTLPCNVIGGMREILLALLNGASLYPFNIREEGLSGLAHGLIEEEVSVCRFISTVFRNFLGTLTGDEHFPMLRLIYVGGEPVHKRDVELYKKYFSSNCIFVNVLGATETGIFRHYYITKETQITGDNVPVGYAVEDMETLLLNDAGQQVGINQSGEIAVKSRYLSPGYWRQPDLTRAKFLPDANGGEERIYLSGDLGLMLRDGCIYHVGRKDFQVKIRGHRIEVGDVEAALLALVAIKEALVIATDRLGEKRLVAYIVPAEKPPPSVGTLRRAMAEKLPDHMIPSTFVLLDAMLLTPNGKVDRQNLAEADNPRPELQAAYAAPRTLVEKILARIWADVIGLEQVGIHDNFFELGGDSLSATRVVSRVLKHFQLEIPLKFLFQAPTIAAMGALITVCQGQGLDENELGKLLNEVESLSDEEVQQLVGEGRRGDYKS